MKTISADAIADAIDNIARSIAEAHKDSPSIALAGIANGGIACAALLHKALQELMGREIGQGILDISFHRDDIGHKPFTKEVEGTELFHDPEETVIIMVDDVLFSGRSTRAALDELHTLGRPKKVELAVLVDRGNRQLPIAADYAGMEIETTPEQEVEVSIDLEHPASSRIIIR